MNETKILHCMEYVDAELICEADAEMPAHKTHPARLRRIIIAATLIICITALFLISYHAIDNKSNQNDLNHKMGGVTDEIIGKKDNNYVFEPNAAKISESDIDYSLSDKVKEIVETEGYSRIFEDICEWIHGEDGINMTDTSNLSISTNNMVMINLRDGSVSAVYKFIYCDDKQIGNLMFHEYEGKVDFTLSPVIEDTDGFYMHFLKNNQDMNFILLTDGTEIYFLSEDNRIYNPSTGAEAKIAVEGDCFHAFAEDMIVSYEILKEQTYMDK